MVESGVGANGYYKPLSTLYKLLIGKAQKCLIEGSFC